MRFLLSLILGLISPLAATPVIGLQNPYLPSTGAGAVGGLDVNYQLVSSTITLAGGAPLPDVPGQAHVVTSFPRGAGWGQTFGDPPAKWISWDADQSNWSRRSKQTRPRYVSAGSLIYRLAFETEPGSYLAGLGGQVLSDDVVSILLTCDSGCGQSWGPSRVLRNAGSPANWQIETPLLPGGSYQLDFTAQSLGGPVGLAATAGGFFIGRGYDTPQVPEPATTLLSAGVLLGFAIVRRIRGSS